MKYALPWRKWCEDTNTYYRICNQKNLVAYVRYRELTHDWIVYRLDFDKLQISSAEEMLISESFEEAIKLCDERLVANGYKLLDERLRTFE